MKSFKHENLFYLHLYMSSEVQALRDFLGGYCADLSISMKFGTDVDQNILNSFFEGAEVGAHLDHHIL